MIGGFVERCGGGGQGGISEIEAGCSKDLCGHQKTTTALSIPCKP